jgi:PAS domain S-box-containing protein
MEDCRVAYAVTDRDLKVVEVSGSMDVLHRVHEDCLGRSLLELLPELVGSEAVLADILAGDLPRFELRWVNRETADGQTVYLTMVDLPYRDQTGQITGLVHVIKDFTEAGVIEQELAQRCNELRLLQDHLTRQNLELAAANAEMRRLDELKSTFVSVAAHELRTPLTSITGFVEVLLDEELGPLTGNQREYLGTVQRSAQRLLGLTNNLLDAARIDAGRIEVVLQPADLVALLETVAAECEPQLKAKAQRLTLHTRPDLPSVLCDRARAAQIIGNLLNNAVKYTPEGGLISARLALAEEQGFLQVSVMDNGVGIPAEDQPRLFDRFFRAKTALLTEANGAGLGLHITRSLVELHGGRIWFESVPHKGSTFHVTFPLADRPA